MDGFSIFTGKRTKPDFLIYDAEENAVINTSEYRAAAMYSEPEVQVFPKQLKQLKTVPYVTTQKQ
jgi:hypothetical protein